MREFLWLVRVAQQDELPQDAQRPSSKAAGESKPEAYAPGYVEDSDKPKTLLADFSAPF
jgi:hypothetical protein